jgi:hypothetical protein
MIFWDICHARRWARMGYADEGCCEKYGGGCMDSLKSMKVSRRSFLKTVGLAALGAMLPLEWAGGTQRTAAAGSLDPMRHVLNRLTWGACPADLEKIRALGIEGYIEWQLQPERIPDPAIDELFEAQPVLLANYYQAKRFEQSDWQLSYILMWTRLYRAAHSQRQLYERMVEFWTDHFNVPITDSAVEKLLDDREVIRRHALGHFRDLLFSSAQSPAMLYYLNNDSSDKEHPNENYAREVMELHTLGVAGGYTEQDVKELARILTGWTVGSGQFYFNAEMHDFGEKQFLGRTFPAGRGLEEGLEALEMLVTHPSTAHFIATKLCRHFVSDDPPESLVRSVAQVFTATDGDIRAMLRHLFTSAEFMNSSGQKLRRPMEFVVAFMRTTGLELTQDYWLLLNALEKLGHMPFCWGPPDGYPDVAEAWLNTNAMLRRWQVALYLPVIALGWIEGARIHLDEMVGVPETAAQLVDRLTEVILPALSLDPRDREMLIQQIAPEPDYRLDDQERSEAIPAIAALLISSPYFQWC